MYVHLAAAVIASFEVPLAMFYDFAIAARFECGGQARYVVFLDGDVQILMRARVHAEQRVHTPTAVDPCIYALGLQLGL